MRFLADMKIRHKLTVLMTLTSALSLILVGGAFIMWQYLSARHALVSSLSTQAEMTADNCEASVAFEVAEDADSVLKTLRLEPSIVYAGVYKESGEVLAQYFRGDTDPGDVVVDVRVNSYYYDDAFLTVFRNITVDNKVIGYVCLRSDLKPIKDLVQANVSVVFSVLVCAVLFTSILALRLQHIISGPILELATTAREVSENKEYGVRAAKSNDDETGALIDAFNEMLTQIQRRDLQMIEINQNLEQKVEERTSELTREIAERKRTEHIVREERNFSKGIIETAQALILVLDTKGNIVSYNPYMEEKSGYSLEEVKGSDWIETFIPSQSRLRIRKVFSRLLNRNSVQAIAGPVSTKDGQIIEIEWYTKVLSDEHGNMSGVLSIGHDVTERKKYENNLKQAKKEAEAANEAKSMFLANMSHEIRTPMNAIIGFSDLLTDEALTATQMEFVNLIKSAGKNLLAIINDILDFSKIEAKKLTVESVEFSLEELLHEFDSIMRPTAMKKNLKYEVIQCGKLPRNIKSDPLRIRQCLTNLINNAIKFTEKGHVFVHTSVDKRDGRDVIVFDVEDTGIGIESDKIESIFQEFNQADNSTTRKFGGTGLGLAITQRLAGLLGGYLSVVSEPGKGSTFSMIIPAGVDTCNVEQANKYKFIDALDQSEKATEEGSFSGKILAAEDNPSNQTLIRMLIEKLGLEVTLVGDGQQALEAVQREHFDIILMDMQMPDMNGYEATKAIRAINITTPIIALTANAMKGDDEKCYNAGCNDYLSKPIDRTQLQKKLEKYLSSEVTAHFGSDSPQV